MTKTIKMASYCLLIAGFASSCAKTPLVEEPKSNEQQVGNTNATMGTPNIIVYKTLANGTLKLSQRPNIDFNTNTTTNPIITVTPATQYQTIDGLGVALTGSAACRLSKLSLANRTALFQELFTTSGINLSMVRITIGCSDYSTQEYTYDDMPVGQTDPDLSEFALGGDDTQYVIPMLKEIIAVASAAGKDLYIVATPWSAPAWMKRNKSLHELTAADETTGNDWDTDNQLMTGYYSTFADYIVKYIQKMKSLHNITISAITPQNEPRNTEWDYPSMYMSAADEIMFVRDELRPSLTSAGLTTKIFAGDTNWSGSDYHSTFMANTNARNAVQGMAFHGYGGEPDVMTPLHNSYPNHEIHMTEWCGNTADSFSSALTSNTRQKIVWTFKNWAKSVMFWNLALDENSEPNIRAGVNSSRPVLEIHTGSLALTRNVDYYTLGHAAKFLRAGAKRIASTDITANNVHNVAFINPDGWKTLVTTNTGTTAQTIDVKIGTQKFTYTLDANSVVTFNWN